MKTFTLSNWKINRLNTRYTEQELERFIPVDGRNIHNRYTLTQASH